jgi:hypothetical protein
MSSRIEVSSPKLGGLVPGHCVMSGVEAGGDLHINIPDKPENYPVAPVKLTAIPGGVIFRRVDMKPIQVIDRQYGLGGKVFRLPVDYVAFRATGDPDVWQSITPGMEVSDEDLLGNFMEVVAGVARDKMQKGCYQFRFFEDK